VPPGAVVVVVLELDDDELHAVSSAAAARPIAASEAVRRPFRADVAFRVLIRFVSSVFVSGEDRVHGRRVASVLTTDGTQAI